jgi:NADH:ubiquinone oxidoreductase subunit 6 (subunit J)
MHLLYSVIENLLVMILSVAVLAGGIYLLLLFLQFWLKVKSAGREEQGLSEIWEEIQIKDKMKINKDHSEE